MRYSLRTLLILMTVVLTLELVALLFSDLFVGIIGWALLVALFALVYWLLRKAQSRDPATRGLGDCAIRLRGPVLTATAPISGSQLIVGLFTAFNMMLMSVMLFAIWARRDRGVSDGFTNMGLLSFGRPIVVASYFCGLLVSSLCLLGRTHRERSTGTVAILMHVSALSVGAWAYYQGMASHD